MTATQQKRRATLVGNHPVCSHLSMDEAYEAADVIGTGSFGNVDRIIRKVRRRTDGIFLARKELNYGRMDERDLRQLTEEVNILEQLGSNDYIVRYYERFVDKPNNMLYILMEYCEGGDLAAQIQRCRRAGTYINEEIVWSYLAQLTLALSDCHAETDAKGERKAVILHRDIKPENVFLDKEGNLKLGDFGLSKAMAQAAMTQTYVGTPYYMSPELINGQLYDVKSDIWALGCLIYELCAGHPPFHEARTQPELAVMIREGKIPDLPKPYSQHLGQIVKAMLKQSPKHRPNTTQLKSLDRVQMQIRVLELRKATKEIRQRGELIAAREAEVMTREASLSAREQAVLAREQAIVSRENSLRANTEALRDMHAKLIMQQQHHQHQQQQQAIGMSRELSSESDLENLRPRTSMGGPGEDLLARVASRPSMVPRRPLEERRASNVGPIPFPRLPSSSSLMSLDDTPIKERMIQFGRRLTSKSMHDISSVAARQSMSRDASPGRQDPALTRSPTRSSFGRRSDSGASHSSHHSLGSHHSATMENPFDLASLPPLPTPPPQPTPPSPSRATRPIAGRPSMDNLRSAAAVPKYDMDDIPSPFIKKMESLRFPPPTAAAPAIVTQAKGTAPAVPGRPAPRASRMSLGNKPSMASRLLAARAQNAGQTMSEDGRRLSSNQNVRGQAMV